MWKKRSRISFVGVQGMPGELGKPVQIPKNQEEERREKFKINQETAIIMLLLFTNVLLVT